MDLGQIREAVRIVRKRAAGDRNRSVRQHDARPRARSCRSGRRLHQRRRAHALRARARPVAAYSGVSCELLQTLDGVGRRTLSRMAAALAVPGLHVVASTGSTNDDLRALAEAGRAGAGPPSGGWQTAGRGRRGRPWQAPPGKSLLLSTLLRPRTRTRAAPPAPVRVGLRIAAAHRAGGRCPTRVIKWPNDLRCAAAARLGGILCEGAARRAGRLHRRWHWH